MSKIEQLASEAQARRELRRIAAESAAAEDSESAEANDAGEPTEFEYETVYEMEYEEEIDDAGPFVTLQPLDRFGLSTFFKATGLQNTYTVPRRELVRAPGLDFSPPRRYAAP